MKKSFTFLHLPTLNGPCTCNDSVTNISSAFGKISFSILFFLLLSAAASAQITAGFELEGNAVSVAPNPPDDWDLIQNGTSHAQVNTGIVLDMPPGNDNAFYTGSSDLLDVPDWGWQLFSTPAKDNILHGGAALYNNDQIYFFGDRYATNGDAQIGFWFFKNAVGPNPDGSFHGTHAVGDILLLSNFVNGGGVPVIKAYEWVGSGGSDGSLNLLSVTGGNLFAIVNSTNETSPWPFQPKFGPANIFGPGAFFEGGIDLAGLGAGVDPCFTSFLLETRSSQSISAELKDFLFGSFFTQPQVAVNSTSICIGASATLTATVTGGAGPFNYSWSNGATTSSITVSPSSTTTYTVTVTAANGCVANPASGTVTVNPAPACSIGTISPGNLICNHGNYTVSTTATGSLSWTMSVDGNPPGWGIIGSSTGQTITFSAGNCGNPGFLVHFFLSVADANGCTSSCSADFAPGAPACNVDIRPPVVLNCTHSSQWILASYSTAILNPVFNWTRNSVGIGAGINDGNGLDSILVTGPGTYKFTVMDLANSGNNCLAQTVVIQDTVAPGVTAVGGTLMCNTTSVPISASSSTTSVTYSWTGPNGFTSTQQNPIVSVAGNYTVTTTNPVNGCTSSATVVVNTNTAVPGVTATGGQLTCAVTALHVTASSPTTGVIYYWTGPNGFSSTQQNPIVHAPGNYTVVVSNQINGCTSTAIATVTQDIAAPTASATGGTMNCVVTSTQLSASSQASGATYSWTGPAGFTSTLSNPTVTASGLYIVVVTNPANGCTNTTAALVINNTTHPTIRVTGGQLNCVVTSVSLSASSSTIAAGYSWTGPNGFTSTLQSPAVSAPGTYIVTVTNPVNGCTNSAHVSVSQNITAPGASASGGELNCIVTSVQLNATSSTAGVTFSWTGPNGFSSSQQNPTVNGAGTYSVIVTNPVNGCTSMATANVSQNTSAPGASAAGGQLNCITTSVQLVASSSTGGVLFSWTGPNGFSSNQQNPIVNGAGMYTVIVTNPVNGCTSMATANVSQNTAAPGANAAGGQLNCATTSVQLLASSPTGGVLFSWTGPNGFTSSQQNPMVNGAGIYTVTVTNPLNGCTSMATATVTQNTTAPTVNASGGQMNCGASSVQLTASSPTTGVYYSWTGPNGFTSTQQNPTVNTTGNYTVVVTNPVNGCTGSATVVVTQTAGNLACNIPTPYEPYCGSSNNTMSVSASGGTAPYTFSWSVTGTNWYITAGGNTSLVTYHAGSVSGAVFTVVVTDANGCTSSCARSASCYSPRPEPGTGDNSAPGIVLNAYPNPFAHSTTVEFGFNEFSADANVEVYNVSGARVATLFKGQTAQGHVYKADFDASSFAEGIYFCRVTANDNVYYLKLMLLNQ
jgi:hypothetical protein